MPTKQRTPSRAHAAWITRMFPDAFRAVVIDGYAHVPKRRNANGLLVPRPPADAAERVQRLAAFAQVRTAVQALFNDPRYCAFFDAQPDHDRQRALGALTAWLHVWRDKRAVLGDAPGSAPVTPRPALVQRTSALPTSPPPAVPTQVATNDAAIHAALRDSLDTIARLHTLTHLSEATNVQVEDLQRRLRDLLDHEPEPQL